MSLSVNVCSTSIDKKIKKHKTKYYTGLQDNEEPSILHMYHTSLLESHQEAWKTFFTMHKNYYVHSMLAKHQHSL